MRKIKVVLFKGLCNESHFQQTSGSEQHFVCPCLFCFSRRWAKTSELAWISENEGFWKENESLFVGHISSHLISTGELRSGQRLHWKQMNRAGLKKTERFSVYRIWITVGCFSKMFFQLVLHDIVGNCGAEAHLLFTNN